MSGSVGVIGGWVRVWSLVGLGCHALGKEGLQGLNCRRGSNLLGPPHFHPEEGLCIYIYFNYDIILRLLSFPPTALLLAYCHGQGKWLLVLQYFGAEYIAFDYLVVERRTFLIEIFLFTWSLGSSKQLAASKFKRPVFTLCKGFYYIRGGIQPDNPGEGEVSLLEPFGRKSEPGEEYCR